MGDPIRFQTDEHIQKGVIRALRARGVDVLTTTDAGLLGATDEKQLEYAHRERRVMITQDQDFLRLAAAGFAHSGIAYARVGNSIGEIQYWLLILGDVMTPEEMENHIEYL